MTYYRKYLGLGNFGDPIEILYCDDCGCAVADTSIHDTYHSARGENP